LLAIPLYRKRTFSVTVQKGVELHAKRHGEEDPFSGTATGFSGAGGRERKIVRRFRSDGPGSFRVEWIIFGFGQGPSVGRTCVTTGHAQGLLRTPRTKAV
jgi:hypothetical protein